MIEYWDYNDAVTVRWELAGLFSRKYGRNLRSVHFVKYMDGAAASKLRRNESDDFLPIGLFYYAGKVCFEAYLSKKGIEFWNKIDPSDDALIPMNLEFLPEENKCKAYFAEIGVLNQLTNIIHFKVTGKTLKSENKMKLTESKLRKIIRTAIIKESFGFNWDTPEGEQLYDAIVHEVHMQGIANNWRAAGEPGRDEEASRQIKRDIQGVVNKVLADPRFIDRSGNDIYIDVDEPAGDYHALHAFATKIGRDIIDDLFDAPDFDPIGDYSTF